MNEENQPIQLAVEFVVPIILHTKEVVENTALSEEDKILIESGFWTKEEAVSFYTFMMTMNSFAASRTEFLSAFRAVTAAYNKQKSGLILPNLNNGNSNIIVPS